MPAAFPDFEAVTEKKRRPTPRETPEIGILNRSKSSLSPKDSRRNSPSESAISPHTGRRVNVTTIGSLSFLHYETAAPAFVRRAISRDRDSILRLANHAGKSVDRGRHSVFSRFPSSCCIANWFRVIGLARLERATIFR